MTKKDPVKIISSEFKGDEKKLLEKLANEEKPNFIPRKEFKEKLDAKIQDKIKTTHEQQEDQAIMNSIPRKLKWRLYLTGYGYAVVSFLILFLIGFCTNIFTGTLKVPTKYIYLEESKAFGNLENGDLVYNYDENSASNYAHNDTEDEENIIKSEESSEDTRATNSISKVIETQTLGTTLNTTENYADNFDVGATDNIYSPDYLLNKNFMFNETYRFAYKNKSFPKLAIEYPIYKSSGILMGSNTSNQVLKSLKIGEVSFKKFQDLEIAEFYIEQKTKNGYSISFNSNSQTLNFYPNDSRQAHKFNDEIPSKKQITKTIEKELKQLGISTKNYGDIEVGIENYDDSMGIISAFCPLKIHRKEVRDAENNERIGMKITYDLNLQKVVSVIGIDIATYDISNYPTSEKSYIENEIEKGGEFFSQGALHENSTVVLLDNMQIVYILKTINGTRYYVPAIKGDVNTQVKNYYGPKHVFQEIVQ